MSFSYNEAVEGQSRSFGYTYEKSSGEVEKILYFTNKSEDYSVKEEDRIEENPLTLGKETRFGILPSSEVLANFKREVLYICGKSGSGKSYQIAKFVEMYHKFYPQNWGTSHSLTIYMLSTDRRSNCNVITTTKLSPGTAF